MLEDAETVTFPSGMAAIAAVLYGLLKPGDRLLLPADGYYTVRVFAADGSGWNLGELFPDVSVGDAPT